MAKVYFYFSALNINLFPISNIPSWMLIICGLLTALSLTYFIIPSIVKVSKLKGLCATPNGRTSHINNTPTFGGIAIFAGFVISSVIFSGTYFKIDLQYIISALFIVLFMGIKDDILIINPWKKLAGQIVATAIISILADIRITNLYGLFGINHLPYILSILLTIVVFLVVINGFNLIDGIDGLASGIGLLTSSVLGIWFWISGNIGYAIVSFSFAGSMLAFFYFNVFSKKNKIFMGDTGSLVTGLVIAVLACSFLQLELTADGIAVIQASPAFAFSILIVPLFDTLRVFTLRILQGKSPFMADRQHIHHRLLQLGMTHLQATLLLVSINMFFILACYLYQRIGIIWLVVGTLGLSTLLSHLLMILVKRKTRKIGLQKYSSDKMLKRENLDRKIIEKPYSSRVIHTPSKANINLN